MTCGSEPLLVDAKVGPETLAKAVGPLNTTVAMAATTAAAVNPAMARRLFRLMSGSSPGLGWVGRQRGRPGHLAVAGPETGKLRTGSSSGRQGTRVADRAPGFAGGQRGGVPVSRRART